MTDANAVAERATAPRRGDVSNRQVVGHYVGRRAGEAAQAVRCAGLKPGLDRAFGCASELFGKVVAQEPTPGSELARNGLVTLHVAAPGGAEEDAKAATQSVAVENPLLPQRDRGEPASTVQAGAKRRRKPGSTKRKAHGLDSPPAPTPRLPANYDAPDALDYGDWATREIERGDSDDEQSMPENPGSEDSTGEEFVVRAEELFAGRAGSPWRRMYPQRRRGTDLRARVAEHPLLVRVALALLAVWVLVGVAAALRADSGAPRRSAPPRQTASGPLARVSGLRPSTETRSPARAPVPKATRPSARRRGQSRLRKRSAVLGQPASPPAAGSAPTFTRPVAVAPSPPPSPVQTEGHGGPFSP